MKKLMTLAILLVCTFANAQKYGWINSPELLDVMPEKKKANATLDSMYKAEENILKILEADYTKLATEYSDKKKKGPIPPDEEKRYAENLGRIENALYDRQNTAEQEIKKKEQALIMPILDKINKAIQEVGKANGYQYIFDISLGNVIYYPEGDNVLKLVKKQLGLPVMD